MAARLPARCRRLIPAFFASNGTVNSVCTSDEIMGVLMDSLAATKARVAVEYVCKVVAAWSALGPHWESIMMLQ